MSKKRKFIIIIAVSVIPLVIMCLAACGMFGGADDVFCFADIGDEAWSDDFNVVSKEDIGGYMPMRGSSSGRYFRDKLSGNGLYIYNAVAYAVDNCYSRVYIPESCFKSGDEVSQVINYFSCDDPFLEHNFTAEGIFRLSSVTIKAGAYFGKTMYFFELPRNTKEYRYKKEQAYSAAKKIVNEMPAECRTDMQKARYLYGYVTENVRYSDESTYSFDTVPIYDALSDGSHMTVCDGFADAVTMLFSLSGIPAFSVVGTNKNGGHVLNAAMIDGEYYYFDPSADSTACAQGFDGIFYFMMSDGTAKNYFDFGEIYLPYLPSCPNDAYAYTADVVVKKADYDESVAAAAAELNSDKNVTLWFEAGISDSEKKEFAQRVLSVSGGEMQTAEYNGLVGYALA